MLAELRSNFRVINSLRQTLKLMDDITAESSKLVCDDLEASVDRHRANVAFRMSGEVTTYGEMDTLANRVAHWALEQGLKPGDTVALFMENRAEYVPVWFGLMKVGVVTAMINSNLTDKSLAHCISVVGAQHIITGRRQDQAVATLAEHLESDYTVWTFGGELTPAVEDFGAAIARQPGSRPPRSHRDGIVAGDLGLYIFTSGTTGLPKAARLTHMRIQSMMRAFIKICRFTARDRLYITLPLYHSTGGTCGVGLVLLTGASIILREKFSASEFWDEAVSEGATGFVYIGELCRYLINQPPHPLERQHKIRTGFGNGLRPDVWERFDDRFQIPHLAEFYGSTEGNVSLCNVDGKVGACGVIPPLVASKFSHVKFVKFDIETEQPIRDEHGRCIETEDGEAGEAVGRISSEGRERFEGYSDKGSTEKKILRDAFDEGDMWFRTGDLMRRDKDGYIYFVDRIGDTFRWKAENVSTNEVSEILSAAPGVAMANVYGVPIPGMDGKAGMAAITTHGEIDFDALYEWLAARLPKYAVPLFIRLQTEAETTGTFKFRKVDLVKEGFDPGKVADPLWFAHPERRAYEPLTQDVFETILAGGYKF